jgi:pentatricopeptide repeat protein
VNDLLLLLSLLTATNQVQAASNLVQQTTGISIKTPAADSPVERAFKKIMEDDDAAHAEAEKMVASLKGEPEKSPGLGDATVNLKIEQRLLPIRKEYEEFIFHNPEHIGARLAFGSFLDGIGEEDEARVQWEKALELDPKNPATYNNLANAYGHHGPIEKAFDYYTKAIELNPSESVYYHNFGTTIFLFRKAAMEKYKITEQQVFDRALELYGKAQKYDPDNFELATDIAQTYYGIKPPRPDDAIKSWDYAMKIAENDAQRQAVHIHLARVKIHAGRFDEAREHLAKISEPRLNDLKVRVTKLLDDKEKLAKEGKDPEAAKPETKPDVTKQ